MVKMFFSGEKKRYDSIDKLQLDMQRNQKALEKERQKVERENAINQRLMSHERLKDQLAEMKAEDR